MAEQKHGWFAIPGRQTGDRTIASQVQGLDQIDFTGKTVLDLGCAEGAVSLYALNRGANSVYGIDNRHECIIEAYNLCRGQNADFWTYDLEKPLQGNLLLLRHYDIVLMLSVLHKLAAPLKVLDHAASVGDTLAVRLVARVLADARSAPLVVDIPDYLGQRGFALVAEPVTSVEPKSGKPEWLGIFRRT